ncbi:hypothetical protein [Acuticoccus kandeliae]|uniref:hypothetical protein n=1 Tax=Acuticoccus kandeliae TaxID=2073160 RepID=UPI001300971D|nr:hypothetical protein [Acuticoccus kandeliae]
MRAGDPSWTLPAGTGNRVRSGPFSTINAIEVVFVLISLFAALTWTYLRRRESKTPR